MGMSSCIRWRQCLCWALLLALLTLLSLCQASPGAGLLQHQSHGLKLSNNRRLLQINLPNATDCPATQIVAFHRPYTTASVSLNTTSCYSIPFKMELTDNYVNRLTNETQSFTYIYNGTLVSGTNYLDCSSIRLQTGAFLIDDYFSSLRLPTTQQLLAWDPLSAPFNRPYLPFPKSDICLNKDGICLFNTTICGNSTVECPVTCGTCNTTWIHRDITYRVLEASVGDCCGPDVNCRLAKNYVSELQWGVPEGTPVPPPAPSPPAVRAPFGTVTCSFTPWEALLAPKSTQVYTDKGYSSCLGLDTTVVMEETFTDLRANRTLRTRFTRQGTLVTGDNKVLACGPSINTTAVLNSWMQGTVRIGGVSYGLKPFLITSYGSRSDGLYPPESVCYDQDFRCFNPTNPCQPGSDLLVRNLCPVRCGGCGSALIMRLDDISIVDIRGSVTTCCDANNDNNCTSWKSVMESNGLPTVILEANPPPGTPGSTQPPPTPTRDIILPPTPTPSPVNSSGSSSSNKTAIIGGAVGGGVGLLLLAALLFVLCKRKPGGHSGGKAPLVITPQDHIGINNDRDLPPPGPGFGPLKIKGLSTAEPFVRGTAYEYSWAPVSVSAVDKQCVEADVNDVQLDRMVPPAAKAAPGPHTPLAPVYLSKEELKKQVFMLQDGFLGKGATAVVFKATWPSRFGPDAVLACKMLKDGSDADIATLESFSHEAMVLASARHPNVIRMYGYCMEPPNVCLILEVLQHSVKDLLYKTKSPASGTIPWGSKTNGAGTNTSDGDWSSSQQVQATAVDSASITAVNPAVVAQVHIVSPHSRTSDKSLPTGTSAGEATNKLFTTPPELPPLSMAQVLQIGADVAAGLAYLHDTPLNDEVLASFRASRPVMMGSPASPSTDGGYAFSAPPTPGDPNKQGKIVHRDLKPANVLMNSLGRAKLSDFGLARQHQQTTIQTERAGAGTLPYMSPELLTSAYSRFKQSMTNKVDIYSFAMILYEMLAREMPWKGHSEMAIVTAVTSGNRPPLPADEDKHDSDQAPPSPTTLAQTPASLSAMPELNAIIRACWHQRDVKRPTAATVHAQLMHLLRGRHVRHNETYSNACCNRHAALLCTQWQLGDCHTRFKLTVVCYVAVAWGFKLAQLVSHMS